MSPWRSRLFALLFGASEPVPPRDPHAPRVRTGIVGPTLTAERETELRERGRVFVDLVLSRTRVDRDGHFTPPRFG